MKADYPKFKFNQRVRVQNEDYCYTTFNVMADLMELTKYSYGRPPEHLEGKIVTIVGKSYHSDTGRLVYGIRTQSGKEYIIGQNGLTDVTVDVKIENEYIAIPESEIHKVKKFLRDLIKEADKDK